MREAVPGTGSRPRQVCAGIFSRRPTRSSTPSTTASPRRCAKSWGTCSSRSSSSPGSTRSAATFTVRDVARDITEKMTRRHPHVFADSTAGTSAEVLRQWEDIKRREKASEASAPARPARPLDGVPRRCPRSARRAARHAGRARRVRLDGHPGVIEKVEEEVGGAARGRGGGELRERVAEEFGDSCSRSRTSRGIWASMPKARCRRRTTASATASATSRTSCAAAGATPPRRPRGARRLWQQAKQEPRSAARGSGTTLFGEAPHSPELDVARLETLGRRHARELLELPLEDGVEERRRQRRIRVRAARRLGDDLVDQAELAQVRRRELQRRAASLAMPGIASTGSRRTLRR